VPTETPARLATSFTLGGGDLRDSLGTPLFYEKIMLWSICFTGAHEARR